MISFITTSGNFLKVLIKKVRSPCAESTDILVSLFAALVISFKKNPQTNKTPPHNLAFSIVILQSTDVLDLSFLSLYGMYKNFN